LIDATFAELRKLQNLLFVKTILDFQIHEVHFHKTHKERLRNNTVPVMFKIFTCEFRKRQSYVEN